MENKEDKKQEPLLVQFMKYKQNDTEGPEISDEDKIRIRKDKIKKIIDEPSDGNSYTINNSKALGGEIDLPAKNELINFLIDFAPTALFAIGSKALSKSNLNKNARIQEHKNHTKYNTSDGPVTYVEGRIANHIKDGNKLEGGPEGALSKILYDTYGKEIQKGLPKKLEALRSNLYKGVDEISSKYNLHNKELDDIAKDIMNDTYKRGSSKAGDELQDLIKSYNANYEKANPLAQSVLDTALKQNESVSNIAKNGPNVGYGLAAANAVNAIADKGAIEPSGLPGIRDLLDAMTGETWKYNRKEIIKQIDKWYNSTIDSVDDETKKELNRIYLNIDLNSEKDVIQGLKNIQDTLKSYQKKQRYKLF